MHKEKIIKRISNYHDFISSPEFLEKFDNPEQRESREMCISQESFICAFVTTEGLYRTYKLHNGVIVMKKVFKEAGIRNGRLRKILFEKNEIIFTDQYRSPKRSIELAHDGYVYQLDLI